MLTTNPAEPPKAAAGQEKEDEQMKLMKWTPRANYLNPVDSDFDHLFRDFFGGSWGDFRAPEAGWSPSTDIVEEEGRFLVKLDLPGMKREEINVKVANGALTVTGERKHESESNKGYRRFERSYGQFTRVFTLPETVDGQKIEADYQDGVLTVAIPKSEAALPKEIEVKVR